MNDWSQNPMALAGLAVMQGAPVGQALAQANQMVYQQQAAQVQQQKAQLQMEQFRREQEFAKALPGLLANNPDLNTLLSQGVAAGGDPELLIKLGQQQRLTQQQEMTNQLLGDVLGGGIAPTGGAGGGMADPSKLIAAGAMIGNPQLIQLGTFAQTRADREEDRRLKLEDEARKVAVEKEKDASKPLTSEATQRIALARQGLGGVASIRQLAFDKDGKLNKNVIAQVQAGKPITPEAKKLYNAAFRATEAKLRLDTGAAATRDEINRNIAANLPGILDNEDSARYKLDELEPYFNDVIGLLNPQDASGRQNLNSPTTSKGGPAIGVVEDGYRFKGGNPADPASWEQVR